MPKPERLPADLKELCGLCRAGKLFAVQEWIQSGKRHEPSPGNWQTTPLRVAIQTGFHSLVEVFLRAGIAQDEKNRALWRAVFERSFDLVRLLVEYGADHRCIDALAVIDARDPPLMRWFIEHGLDMDNGNPIAHAFRYGHRDFLGVFLDIKDRIPSAPRQAAMALRHHAREGNLKWVSLLLWAGADPRFSVPNFDCPDEAEEFFSTAIEDAVLHGHVGVVKKFKLDPVKDDLKKLLRYSAVSCNPEITKLILVLLPASERSVAASEAMNNAMHQLGWGLDANPPWGSSCYRAESAIKSMAVLAEYGGRWNPPDTYDWSCLRRALGKADDYRSVPALKGLVESRVIEEATFAKLMSTPKMRKILSSCVPGVVQLRRIAGFEKK